MTYFANINSLEELRKEYKRLVKLNHPDNGGSLDTIKIINVEYERIFVVLKNADSQTANKDKYNSGIDRAMRKVIDNIINLNIVIEICGSWIWISGNTFPVKDALKANGFRWAPKKKMWQWHSPEEKSKSRGLDMDLIRNKYGSQVIKKAAGTKYIAC